VQGRSHRRASLGIQAATAFFLLAVTLPVADPTQLPAAFLDRSQGLSGSVGNHAGLQLCSCLNGGKWKIIAEFTEVESGKRSDRPQLDAALKAARLHRAALVVSKVDRLGNGQDRARC
jgi:hypothetical protein